MPNISIVVKKVAGVLFVAMVLAGCASTDSTEKAEPAPFRKTGEQPGATSSTGQPATPPARETTKPSAVIEENLGGQGRGSNMASPVMVRQVQGWLNALRFDAGPPDGKANPRTTEAIRKYQKQRGLPVDGKITEALRDRLRNEAGARQTQ